MSHSFYAGTRIIDASQDSAFIVLTIIDLTLFVDSSEPRDFLFILYEIH